MAAEDEEGEEPERSPIDQLDMVKSYGAFAWRAIRRRKVAMGLTFVVVFGVAMGVLALWPRTYHCESTILISQSGALIGSDERGAYRGAGDLIRRRENALKVVRDTDLARRSIAERPKFQRFKDWVFRRGEPRAEDMEAPLVWAVQTSLWIRQEGESLVFGVDWGAPESAALLVAAAQKIYLAERHVSEISTIQEKMQIMDGHAVRTRKEIEEIAEQIKGMREEKVNQATKPKVAPVASSPPAASSGAPVASGAPARPRAPTIRIVQTQTPIPESELAARKEQIATLKEDLEAKKRAMKEIKEQRNQKLVVAQAQMNELLTKYTPAHPEVKRLERTIEQLSADDAARTAPIQTEIANMTAKIKELESAPTTTTGPMVTRSYVGGGRATSKDSGSGPAKAEALPADILRLLDNETETDPAVTVQLQGAISKYAGMRDGIRTAQLELDTAQAAFNHRYKIIEPPEAPLAPIKPNVRNTALGAFAGALVLALLLAMLLELRKGKIVERWQVYQMKLPILADLELPPGSRD
jgi:uncharacterized protein involved in exopolysaccharide biosynthesis